MNPIVKIERRDFLKGFVGLSGGLLLGIRPSRARAETSGQIPWSPNVFLSLDIDGLVTIIAHRSEMGTGIRTCLPAIVADELGAEWSRVKIEQAIGDEKYGSQNTDGSRSVRNFFEAMRVAGATARTMLERAAAAEWGVDASSVMVSGHEIRHASGKTARFADMVTKAAALPVPDPEELTYRSPSAYRYIGKDFPVVDRADITTGTAEFGMDVQIDGMKYAAVARCPVIGGGVVSFDATEALATAGVEQVVQLPEPDAPLAFHALGGVAVIATNTWAAFQGKSKLRVEWDYGANADYDSDSFREALTETVNKPGEVARSRGDVDGAMAVAPAQHAAEYHLPHLAHAPMEPPAATARVAGDRCEAWAATQNPQAAQGELAQVLGLQKKNVIVHVTLLGGGFGRKSKPDFVAEAALLSREINLPVKVVWSREDDIQFDYYHAVAACRIEAGLDEAGKPLAMLMRSAFTPIGSTFETGAETPADWEMGFGFSDVPFDVPNIRCEKGKAKAHVRIGWLRSVCNIYHAFAVSSFADELAARAGADPLEYLLELIGSPRKIDLAAEGAKYSNYGASIEKFPIDTGRLRHVTEQAAKNSGWGRQLPRGRSLGIASHRSFLTYVANVVEVEVTKDGQVNIPRVDVVADLGLVINPDRVKAQFEGSAVFGASLALNGEITAKRGRVVQSNFHDYKVCRMNEAPRQVHVHLVDSVEPPAGAGEPGVPPFAPALANAIFAATGKRVRSLPLSAHDLSWS